jgi:uncharacterized Zn finger protein (UPF0148 family)
MSVSTKACPECGAILFYEQSTRHFVCRNCGIFVTREELYDIRERKKEQAELDIKERRRRIMSEYLDWLLKKST